MKLSICLQVCLVFPAIVHVGRTQESETPPLLDELKSVPRISVMEAVVSVDGGLRPDLGRSFSDSLIAGLLKRGQVDVIDASLAPVGPPTQPGPLDLGNRPVDFVVVPTLVSEPQFFRLTIKKVALPSGRIEAVVQETGSGALPRLSDLAALAVEQLLPPTRRESPPVSTIRGWMSGPDEEAGFLPEVPPAVAAPLAADRIATVPPPIEIESKSRPRVIQSAIVGPVAREIEEIGRVTAANAAYSFCVIDPHRGRTLKPGDSVMIGVNDWIRPTLPATVTRIERGHAIAEYKTGSVAPPRVGPGARVYEWVPESTTTPSPTLPAVLDPLPPAF